MLQGKKAEKAGFFPKKMRRSTYQISPKFANRAPTA
jgi:hypothetical protein